MSIAVPAQWQEFDYETKYDIYDQTVEDGQQTTLDPSQTTYTLPTPAPTQRKSRSRRRHNPMSRKAKQVQFEGDDQDSKSQRTLANVRERQRTESLNKAFQVKSKISRLHLANIGIRRVTEPSTHNSNNAIRQTVQNSDAATSQQVHQLPVRGECVKNEICIELNGNWES